MYILMKNYTFNTYGDKVENPNEIDPRIPVETDPLFFFHLAPGIAKFSRQA